MPPHRWQAQSFHFGFKLGVPRRDLFRQLLYCPVNDASSSIRVSTSIEAITILQLNLRIRAPFAITIDAGHESKGRA